MPCRECTNYNRLGQFPKDCRARPRMVNLLNARKPTLAHGALMTSNNVTFIASFIPLIMEYLVKISKKACILKLKRRHLKINDSDILYVAVISEETDTVECGTVAAVWRWAVEVEAEVEYGVRTEN
ncbi:hypothetical protein Tco_0759712 [Tanacetum coccineum]